METNVRNATLTAILGPQTLAELHAATVRDLHLDDLPLTLTRDDYLTFIDRAGAKLSRGAGGLTVGETLALWRFVACEAEDARWLGDADVSDRSHAAKLAAITRKSGLRFQR